MKRYGVWKYFLIVFFLIFGLVYALPNLYAPDPAVQISYNNSSQEPDTGLKLRIQEVLSSSKLGKTSFNIETNQNFILVRLSSTGEQLEVKRLLSEGLGDDVIVALNLAHTTPEWLVNLGAKPMKLGLDLRGGVHFLMEVDTKAAIINRQNGVLQDIRRKLREDKIPYSSAYVEEDQSISLSFNLNNTSADLKSIIEDYYPQFFLVDYVNSYY